MTTQPREPDRREPSLEVEDALRQERDELAMLVNRLCRRIRLRYDLDDTMAEKALDYLRRHALTNPLRRTQ